MAVGLAELRLAMLLPVFLVPCRQNQNQIHWIYPQDVLTRCTCTLAVFYSPLPTCGLTFHTDN